MTRFFSCFAASLLLLWPTLASSEQTRQPDILKMLNLPAFPSSEASADEMPVTGDGTSETDRLLTCYAKFQGPDLKGDALGPPRITHSDQFGYVLRADFKAKKGEAPSRLVCSSHGFVTGSGGSPLYPPDSTTPDAATQKVIDGWIARRNAEARAEATASRSQPPDADTVRYLEGIWLIGAQPDKGACIANAYEQTQVEFEFRKTGGRVQIFEPEPYLFTAISISGIQKQDDLLVLQGAVRNGGYRTIMRLRKLPPDRIEVLPQTNARPGAQPEFAYRCGAANTAVNESIDLETLATFAPPVSGGWSLVSTVPGIPDSDICQGTAKLNAEQEKAFRSLQLEFYGPVHYYVFGWNFWPAHRLSFDLIRGMKREGDHTLKLEMQEHVLGRGGWDIPASQGKPYELTLIDHGDRIEIPELATTFAKCEPENPASVGWHRM